METKKYDNSVVRRQDRLMVETRARKVLRNGEYGVLSMTDSAGVPYGIPISYALDEAGDIYLHCGPAGRKIEIIAEGTPVSFCVVGRTKVIPHKFTTNFESVIVEGFASVVANEAERWKCLRLILEKYSPNDMEVGMKYAEKSFFRTMCIRITVSKISGKRKWIAE